MGTELITAETGARLTINYPDSFPAAVVQLALPAAARVLTELVKAGYNIHNDVQRHRMALRVEQAFREEAEKIMRQDVVPIMGIAKAHQFGRDYLRGAGLDADLEQDALQALKRRQDKRLQG